MTCTPTHARTALTNVRVFDGRQLLAPGTVVVQAGRIVADTHGARVVDGAAGVLLPGLIDAHVHLHGRETLERLCGFGVTTALDMACGPPELVDSLRGVKGLTDIRSAGTPAIAPGSLHSRIPGLGHCGLVSGADEAARFVAERVAEGSDYIKIIVGNAGPSHDQATLDALVGAARAHGKLTVAHASSYAAPWRWRSGGGRRRHTRAAGPCPGLGGRGPHRRRRPHPRADAVDDGRHHRAVGTAGRALRRGRKSVATLFRAGVPILAAEPTRTPHPASRRRSATATASTMSWSCSLTPG